MEALKIIGVFDRQDILLDLQKSPFFIVGPNGTGKSTSLKILHYILTRQWSRLSDLPFNGIEAKFHDETLFIDRNDLTRFDRFRSYLFRYRRIGSRPVSNLVPITWEAAKDILTKEPPPTRTLPHRVAPSVVEQLEPNYEAIAKLNNFVERESRGRVLYFPTYRRIERDLRELLEADEDDVGDPFDNDQILAPKIANRFKDAGEVIGFGGQDIRVLLASIASTIEVEARRTLNEHSVRFLEALSKDKASVTKVSRASILTEARTKKLLDRISSSAFAELDIDAVKQSITSLRSKVTTATRGRLTQPQEMLLFYVSELIKANDKIDTLAAPLAQFSKVISRYLAPVKKSYLRESDNRVIILDSGGNEIELDQLSSGEKQILAFFAFLTLENNVKPKFIIIDEPELSLSVSWQKTLIGDIVDINNDAVVVSATHSPFIFENFPIDHVISLGDL